MPGICCRQKATNKDIALWSHTWHLLLALLKHTNEAGQTYHSVAMT